MVPVPVGPRGRVRATGARTSASHLTLNAEYDLYRWGPITHAPSLLDGDGGFPRTRRRPVGPRRPRRGPPRAAGPRSSGRSCGASTSATSTPTWARSSCKPEFFDIYLDLAVDFGLPAPAVGRRRPSATIGFPFRALAAEEGVVVPRPLRPRRDGVGSRRAIERALARPAARASPRSTSTRRSTRPSCGRTTPDWAGPGRRPRPAGQRPQPAGAARAGGAELIGYRALRDLPAAPAVRRRRVALRRASPCPPSQRTGSLVRRPRHGAAVRAVARASTRSSAPWSPATLARPCMNGDRRGRPRPGRQAGASVYGDVMVTVGARRGGRRPASTSRPSSNADPVARPRRRARPCQSWSTTAVAAGPAPAGSRVRVGPGAHATRRSANATPLGHERASATGRPAAATPANRSSSGTLGVDQAAGQDVVVVGVDRRPAPRGAGRTRTATSGRPGSRGPAGRRARTSSNPAMSIAVVMRSSCDGRSNHSSSNGDSRPSSTKRSCMASMRSRDQTE